jgi:hypothetical protein
LKSRFHQRADVVVVIGNSAVNQHEFLSGKGVVSFVKCPLMNVKLQTISQEFKLRNRLLLFYKKI